MPPLASRIEYRNASNQLVAEVYGSADGVTIAVYSGSAQTAFLQVNPAGRLDISTGGGGIAVDADGNLEIQGAVSLNRLVRLANLADTDPHDQGAVWLDVETGTVKVSAG